VSWAAILHKLWGSQSWLQPAFNRRWRARRLPHRREKPPKKAAAGKIACPTILLLSLLLLSACRQDMHDQPKYVPLRPSDFFADGRSARPITEGTVARGHLNDDTLLYTGKGADGKPSNEFPMPVTKELLLRGQQRFNVYCTPCHDRTGSGNGMIVRRGYRRPPTYHSDRLRQQPNGYLYDVITNGFGAMPDYAAQIPPPDRWAIVAYIRALQLSQQASIGDVPPAARSQLGDAPRSQPGGAK
jgi:Cytochrome C oxidase, cbb3-type, subunit III